MNVWIVETTTKGEDNKRLGLASKLEGVALKKVSTLPDQRAITPYLSQIAGESKRQSTQSFAKEPKSHLIF